MRLVFVNSFPRWGGGVTSTVELCRGMAERGHEVTLVCRPRSVLRQRLEGNARVTVVPVGIRGELNPLPVLRLAQVLRRARPDLVIADRRKDVKFSVAARWLSGDRPIVHRFGAPSPLRNSPLYRFVWTRGVDAMVVVSHAQRDELLERTPWLGAMQIRVIHNGTDTERYRPMPELRPRVRSELGIPESAFVISYHGQLEPRKNVHLLIEAVASTASDHGVHALVIGDGPESSTLHSLARRLRAPVTFTGFREEIPELLSVADVSAHLSGAEGLANSVIEALACGLPVILSDATSNSELIEHGTHGLLVGSRRPELVAAAIRRLARDPANLDDMREFARRRAVQHFARGRMLDRYDSFFRAIVAASPTESRRAGRGAATV